MAASLFSGYRSLLGYSRTMQSKTAISRRGYKPRPPVSTGELGHQFDPKTGEVRQRSGGRSKLERKIESIVFHSAEPKFLDTAMSYTNISASGNLVQITAIPQGTSENNRVGDEVRLRHVQLRVAGYQNNSTATQFPNIVRVIVLRYSANTGIAALGILQVLSGASISNIGGSITSLPNPQSEADGTVQILHDTYHFTSLNSNSFAYKWDMDLDSSIQFNPTATTGTGNLYVLVLSDDAGVVSPCPSVAWSARVTYTDS